MTSVLRVGSALPDPPFELLGAGPSGVAGFDPEVMAAVAPALGRELRVVHYAGATSGSGHRWQLIDDQPWRRLYVELAP